MQALCMKESASNSLKTWDFIQFVYIYEENKGLIHTYFRWDSSMILGILVWDRKKWME